MMNTIIQMIKGIEENNIAEMDRLSEELYSLFEETVIECPFETQEEMKSFTGKDETSIERQWIEKLRDNFYLIFNACLPFDLFIKINRLYLVFEVDSNKDIINRIEENNEAFWNILTGYRFKFLELIKEDKSLWEESGLLEVLSIKSYSLFNDLAKEMSKKENFIEPEETLSDDKFYPKNDMKEGYYEEVKDLHKKIKKEKDFNFLEKYGNITIDQVYKEFKPHRRKLESVRAYEGKEAGKRRVSRKVLPSVDNYIKEIFELTKTKYPFNLSNSTIYKAVNLHIVYKNMDKLK